MAYEVLSWRRGILASIAEAFLRNHGLAPGVLEGKDQIIYLDGYIEALKIKTIIVESEYIDKDFIEDYSNYLVRCFHGYHRFCRRVHFFSKDISESQFEKIILQSEPHALGPYYCGFIVLRPLPKTVVGKTCLIPYPSEEKRHFIASKDYESDLFGLSLCARSTVAFQEQDDIVSACATSALWSAFQLTGRVFQHSVPSPSKITQNAYEVPFVSAKGEEYPHGRLFPNPGLQIPQIIHAITSVGLEAHVMDAKNNKPKSIYSAIQAYLNHDIPCILIFSLEDKSHAVTIIGYGTKIKHNFLKRNIEIIDRIYVHDDKIGPYARMKINNLGKTLSTGIADAYGELPTTAKMESLIFPVYHKIRITYLQAEELASQLNIWLNEWFKSVRSPIGKCHITNIVLTTVQKTRKTIKELDFCRPSLKKELLTSKMPKYLWQISITCNIKNKCSAIYILLDATDIQDGPLFIGAYCDNSTIFDALIEECYQAVSNNLPVGDGGLTTFTLINKLADLYTKHKDKS